ncbi:Lecithin-cholesterol_acyltransferase [Hexamita inflata]|uniref:Lecithin-cholesterol acyltransferase n=1 Tax=Hexamita inflata TaxID=28002 RepID=A0AA86QBU5_9EUKA|nr:Lecithin-cholesterol acyltransferase [Hexamita inflata]
MRGFSSISAEDFNYNYEFIPLSKSSRKKLPPIIVIPGVAGSKMEARNKKTGETECVWINPSLKAITKCGQHLWGTFNEQTEQFESFVHEYCDVYSIKGLAGCDHLIDAKLFDYKLFENSSLTNYFGQFCNYFVKTFGYELGTNLFAFTYDWRQPLDDNKIQSELKKLIKRVKMINEQKVVIVGHSLGGVLVETFMRLNPDFEEDISKFIALGVPFDGVSGYSIQSMILGYNMKQPIPYCVTKGIQVGCGTIPYLLNSAHQQGPINKIFLKKLNSSTQQIQVNEPECGFESPKYDLIKFNDEVYGDEIPDVLYVLAKKMVSKKMLKDEFIEETMRNMQRGCKRGAIQLDFDAESPLKQVAQSVSQIIHAKKKPEELIEKDFEANTPTLSDFARKDYAWESFSVWGKSSWHSLGQREYKYLDSKFMRVGGDLQFSPEFYHENKVAGTRRFSQMQNILDFYLAKQYYMEQQHVGLEQLESCNSSSEYLYGPWCSVKEQTSVEDKSAMDLAQFVHRPGTIDRALYGMSLMPYQKAYDIRKGTIQLKQGSSFRFLSIVGCGCQTPLHVVYQKPISNYEELLYQIPQQINVDGDYTVLTTCALSDPFDNSVVSDRIVINGLKHFPMIADQRVYDIVSKEIGLQ